MPDKHAPPTSKALLDTLTDSTALPALVARLDAPALKRLVDDVGMADAGALIEHASASQLKHLIDESVWASAVPGVPESLDVEALLRWFEVMLDVGESFAAERLLELGDDFCAMAFAKLVTVNGSEADPGDEFSVVIGVYFVGARVTDEWDVVQAVLNDLWGEAPDFLEALLGRLSFRHSVLGIEGENDAGDVLERDAAHEWAENRRRRGFVVAAEAGWFLERIAATELDALVAEDTYDLATAQYFELQAQNAEAASDEADEPAADEEDAPLDEDAELDALQQEFERYETTRAEQRLLLTGPDGHDERLPVRRALAALNADADVMESRAQELSYLSNLVMTGCPLDGARLEEADAANLILATCNLGGAYLGWLDDGALDGDDALLVELLRVEPGLVRLFRLGWKLNAQVPLQVAGALKRALLDERSPTRAGLAGWLVEEVEALLTEPDLVALTRAGRFEEVRESIEILRMVFRPPAVTALCRLVDQVPRVSTLLEMPTPPTDDELSGGLEDEEWRYLSSMRDLQMINGTLNGLHGWVNG